MKKSFNLFASLFAVCFLFTALFISFTGDLDFDDPTSVSTCLLDDGSDDDQPEPATWE